MQTTTRTQPDPLGPPIPTNRIADVHQAAAWMRVVLAHHAVTRQERAEARRLRPQVGDVATILGSGRQYHVDFIDLGIARTRPVDDPDQPGRWISVGMLCRTEV